MAAEKPTVDENTWVVNWKTTEPNPDDDEITANIKRVQREDLEMRARHRANLLRSQQTEPVEETLQSCVRETYLRLKKKMGSDPSQVSVVDNLPSPFGMSRSTFQRRIRKGIISWPPA